MPRLHLPEPQSSNQGPGPDLLYTHRETTAVSNYENCPPVSTCQDSTYQSLSPVTRDQDQIYSTLTEKQQQ
ncbi:hypothetical protein Q5P01_008222 [Channa striata]|uniref:Uncharacterized protein n=1 Tax=Channa striata TaxID=64152 RepID=A0AA88N9U2_CHASR|nr:hypothetical protein Q5P01_008222 [Channa striata]